MMKKQIILWLVPAVAFLFSCGGGPDDNNNDNPYEGQYVTCIIDGDFGNLNFNIVDDSVIAIKYTVTQPYYASINAATGAGGIKSIFIHAQYPAGSDTTITLNDTGVSMVRYLGESIYWQTISGQITLHRLSTTNPLLKEIYTGTFSGTLKNISDLGSTQTITITNGQFRGHRVL